MKISINAHELKDVIRFNKKLMFSSYHQKLWNILFINSFNGEWTPRDYIVKQLNTDDMEFIAIINEFETSKDIMRGHFNFKLMYENDSYRLKLKNELPDYTIENVYEYTEPMIWTSDDLGVETPTISLNIADDEIPMIKLPMDIETAPILEDILKPEMYTVDAKIKDKLGEETGEWGIEMHIEKIGNKYTIKRGTMIYMGVEPSVQKYKDMRDEMVELGKLGRTGSSAWMVLRVPVEISSPTGVLQFILGKAYNKKEILVKED